MNKEGEDPIPANSLTKESVKLREIKRFDF
jgi:hypothetical protein